MKEYTEQHPIFSESIPITETSDPAHADNVNAAPMQLLQNTLANRKEIEELKKGNNEVEFDDIGNGTDIPGGDGEGSEKIPDPAEAIEQITSGKSVPTLIGHIKTTLKGLVPLSKKALDVAMGRNQARVFATVEAMDEWLAVPENVEQMNVGDNLYITATDVPDYWWDGTQQQPLETQKVDLTGYDQQISALQAADREINGNITALQNLMQSFNAAKSRIISSALGIVLGLTASTSLADIATKIASIVNRGTLNWSGNNTTFAVPAGYYPGGTLDSRPSYNSGYNAGVTAADNRANVNSVNYKTGYNAGVADGKANSFDRNTSIRESGVTTTGKFIVISIWTSQTFKGTLKAVSGIPSTVNALWRKDLYYSIVSSSYNSNGGNVFILIMKGTAPVNTSVIPTTVYELRNNADKGSAMTNQYNLMFDF